MKYLIDQVVPILFRQWRELKQQPVIGGAKNRIDHQLRVQAGFEFAPRLVTEKVLRPGASALERLVARIRARAARRLWRTLARDVTHEQRAKLDALLIAGEGEQRALPIGSNGGSAAKALLNAAGARSFAGVTPVIDLPAA